MAPDITQTPWTTSDTLLSVPRALHLTDIAYAVFLLMRDHVITTPRLSSRTGCHSAISRA